MKYEIMINILFRLLSTKMVSAKELAAENDVSVRSIYRYVDEMTVSRVPIDIQHGRGGGIYISESYKLPSNFMTKEEHAATLTALKAMQEQLPCRELLSVIEKLSGRNRAFKSDTSLTGDVIVDSSTWGDYRFDEKLTFLQTALQNCESIEIDYVSRTGESTKRTIDPHILIFKQNVWYVYAYCHIRQEFRLFKVGRIRTTRNTHKTFEKQNFNKKDIPLNFLQDTEEMIGVKLEIDEKLLPDVEEWLGVECIRKENDAFVAVMTLPKGDGLVRKILGLGKGVKVLFPAELKEAVRAEALAIATE